jgi:peptide/nickel transport system permease protein
LRRYILNRLLIAIPVLIGITIFNFAFIHIAPGDPVTMMMPLNLAESTGATFVQTEEWRQEMRARLGLDQPLPVQYVRWMEQIVQGNLGRSIASGRPVRPEVMHRLRATLKLTGTALLISIVVGVSVGMLSAIKQYSFWDHAATFFSFFAVSVPGFFMALVFIDIFALKLKLLPTSGMSTLGAPPSIRDELVHLIMPATVLGLSGTAGLIRYTRSSLLEVLRQDYVVTARAKGLSERVVLLRHAFRNGLLPVITVISLHLPELFGGAVIIEQIFYWQGMGQFGVKAVFDRDYPVIMALNLITATLVLTANLLADITYAVVDPRIRAAFTGKSR